MEPASDWQPDTNVPNAARIYDYLLDGRDNFGPDRELADRIQAEAGDGDGVRELAKINRRFVLSASRWCASMLGVDQFLDCGCGLPLVPAVHDAARQGCPDATVVYADKDAKVISHVETMCWAGEGLAAVAADASDPVAVLAGAAGLLDLARPVAVIFGGTLSAMGADVARNAVQGFTEALAPGSRSSSPVPASPILSSGSGWNGCSGRRDVAQSRRETGRLSSSLRTCGLCEDGPPT